MAKVSQAIANPERNPHPRPHPQPSTLNLHPHLNPCPYPIPYPGPYLYRTRSTEQTRTLLRRVENRTFGGLDSTVAGSPPPSPHVTLSSSTPHPIPTLTLTRCAAP